MSDRQTPSQSEQGTALIAALLLVALMAAVAVQLMDVTRFAAFRTAQIDQRTQAVWMARGARDLAEALAANGALRRLDLSGNELGGLYHHRGQKMRLLPIP